jgi:hypothetical protein
MQAMSVSILLHAAQHPMAELCSLLKAGNRYLWGSCSSYFFNAVHVTRTYFPIFTVGILPCRANS